MVARHRGRAPVDDRVASAAVTRIDVTRADITTVVADAIVNAGNSRLAGGGGVDGAIHRAGGPSILTECREIVARWGECPPGAAVVTGGGDLPARWVIHTVGPIWGGAAPEDDDAVLGSCYEASLDRAAEIGARTVAFPNISTGVYGFPKERAVGVAVAAVAAWGATHPGIVDRVTFVCFDADNERLYGERLAC